MTTNTNYSLIESITVTTDEALNTDVVKRKNALAIQAIDEAKRKLGYAESDSFLSDSKKDVNRIKRQIENARTNADLIIATNERAMQKLNSEGKTVDMNISEEDKLAIRMICLAAEALVNNQSTVKEAKLAEAARKAEEVRLAAKARLAEHARLEEESKERVKKARQAEELGKLNKELKEALILLNNLSDSEAMKLAIRNEEGAEIGKYCLADMDVEVKKYWHNPAELSKNPSLLAKLANDMHEHVHRKSLYGKNTILVVLQEVLRKIKLALVSAFNTITGKPEATVLYNAKCAQKSMQDITDKHNNKINATVAAISPTA